MSSDREDDSQQSRQQPQLPSRDQLRGGLQRVWTSLRSLKLAASSSEDSTDCSASPRKWSPRSEEGQDVAVNPLESMMRTMFGSCTEGNLDALSTKSSTRNNTSFETSPARAQQAVSTIRQQTHELQLHQESSSPARRNHSSSNIPKPFSVSNPRARSSLEEAPIKEVSPTSQHLSSGTFDDGISAISAHTLEELVHEQGFERARSNDSTTLFPPSTVGRDRTWGSSKGGTKSTRSSTTDFEDMWRQDEQQYWQDAVQQDAKGGSRRKPRKDRSTSRSSTRTSDIYKLKNTCTNTTAGSSAFSGLRHPHETMPISPSDFLAISRDPDRIIQDDRIEIDDDAELGEI